MNPSHKTIVKKYLNLIELATPSESTISVCSEGVLDDSGFTLPYAYDEQDATGEKIEIEKGIPVIF